MFKDIITILRGRSPGQVVIQYTDKCNAKCPQCGMRATEKFPRSKLKFNDVKRIIDSAAEKGIKAISFTGGEPFIYLEELVAIIKYAELMQIPYIRTGTNGFIFLNHEKDDFKRRITNIAERLAETKLRNFWISIDSADSELHEEMRGLPGVIKGIEKALPIFHEHGIYPSANLGINRNTGGLANWSKALVTQDTELFYELMITSYRLFYNFVIDLGFTTVNACYPMSIESNDNLNAVYGATSQDDIVSFSTAEKVLLYKALLDVIPEFRSKIRIFTPRSSLYSLVKQYQGQREHGYPCRGGIDYFFINAKDTNTYPCGYRGEENLGKFWDLEITKLDNNAFCKSCDWECFRDPSELIGFLNSMLKNPPLFLRQALKDKQYFNLWLEDLRYYKACNLFDGRIPANYSKMANAVAGGEYANSNF